MLLSHGEILLRLLLATALGIVFGLERERSHKPAGTRTHVLVCLAACVIAMISAYGFKDIYHAYPENVSVRTDPARLVVGVLTGIGFLGAGIIWKSSSGGIQGITTAAEVFLLAALGIATGLGLYFLALAAAAIALLNMAADDLYTHLRQWLRRMRLHLRRKKRRRQAPAANTLQDLQQPAQEIVVRRITAQTPPATDVVHDVQRAEETNQRTADQP